MAEIHVQRRTTGAWLWLLAMIGVILLLWALVRGFEPESEIPPVSPGVLLIGDTQHFVNADVLSSVPVTAADDTRHAVS